MSKVFNIQFLVQEQIDKKKWDRCIEIAGNGLIYGYSFYLDQMARHWDALVMNDYEVIMPLTWNKKYGVYYLYQPFLAAQLGIFGNDIDSGLAESFLKSIPAKFKYWDIYLNQGNVFTLKEFALHQRTNYTLALHRPYEELYRSYRENIQRNIRSSAKAGCILQKDFNVERVIELALQQMRSYGEESTDNVDRFRKMYQVLHSRQMATTYGIISAQKELLASSVFFFSHNRAYYILVGNHPDGKTVGASHALIDAFIKDHAGRNIILDFEGSDIRNLAFFYSSFGGMEEKYATIRLNRLPFYLRWLK